MTAPDPLVPRFQDLTFVGAGDRLDDLASSLERHLGYGWSRSHKHEKSELAGVEFRVFQRGRDGARPCLLFIASNRGDAYVSNIVPTDSHDLGIDEYNAALQEFHQTSGIPAAHEMGMRLELSSDVHDFSGELNSAVFDALRSFSRAANRSTGSAHPMDRERWFKFMVLAHRHHSAPEPDVLRQWLALDGWSDEKAWDLMVEFEFGIGLLRSESSI